MPDSDCRKRMYGRMRSLRLYQLGEGSLVRAELESYLDVLDRCWRQSAQYSRTPCCKAQRAAADGL